MHDMKDTHSVGVCVGTIRSSYPDARDGSDAGMKDGELPDEKTVEFDDDTLELTLPSGTYDVTLRGFWENYLYARL